MHAKIKYLQCSYESVKERDTVQQLTAADPEGGGATRHGGVGYLYIEVVKMRKLHGRSGGGDTERSRIADLKLVYI